MELSYFLDQFRKLNTAKRMGRSAPHKAVMILSVIDLIESERIKKPVFELDEALEKKFHELWKRYVGTSILFKPVPARIAATRLWI